MIFRNSSFSLASARRASSKSRLNIELLEDRRVLATVVLNTDMGIAGELRTELANAAVGETIDFMLAAGDETIVLTQGALSIVQDQVIDGANADGSGVQVTIDAGGDSRVALVDDGSMSSVASVSLSNLTVTGGSDTEGAGILNEEVLQLSGVTVTGNRAQQTNTSFGTFGGGILNRGTLRLDGSTVTQNVARFANGGGNAAFGGGIASVGADALLEVSASSVVSGNNSVGGFGGGVFIQMGTFSLADSTVDGNQAGLDTATYGAIGGYHAGGGISAFSQGPGNTFGALDISITNSSISNNVLSNDNIGSTPFPYGGGFYARGNGSVSMDNATISNNTITGDNTQGSIVGRGGGMFLYGDDNGDLNVDIQSSTIDGNDSIRQGGAIAVRGRYTDDGNPYDDGPVTLDIADTTISNNTAVTLAGGIFNWALNASTPGVAEIHIVDSELSGNTTNGNGSGGAARNWHGGVMTIERTSISNNYGTNGGGISNIGVNLDGGALPPQLTIRDSTFSGNTASGAGGAVYSYDGTLEVHQSTLSGNTASTGGGLYLATFSLYAGTNYETFSSVDRSTFTLNDAATGGGIYSSYYHASTWANSIISGNTGSVAPDVYSGTYVTYSYDYVGGNAMLAPLANNGGSTLTHLPLTGSPVIDMADPAATGVADQRGLARIVGAAMDVGSVEVQGSNPIACDFDSSATCDLIDIDAMVAEIAAGTNNVPFDLTGDGLVNLADRDRWLSLAGELNIGPGRAYLLGDANLDTVVDGLDFIEWNDSKFTTVAAWSAGDFTADGVVDGLDFIEWNNNKFQSADGPVGASLDNGNRLSARAGNCEGTCEKIGAWDDDASRPGHEWILGIEPEGTGIANPIAVLQIETEIQSMSLASNDLDAGNAEFKTASVEFDSQREAFRSQSLGGANRLRPTVTPINASDMPAIDRIMAFELGDLIE